MEFDCQHCGLAQVADDGARKAGTLHVRCTGCETSWFVTPTGVLRAPPPPGRTSTPGAPLAASARVLARRSGRSSLPPPGFVATTTIRPAKAGRTMRRDLLTIAAAAAVAVVVNHAAQRCFERAATPPGPSGETIAGALGPAEPELEPRERAPEPHAEPAAITSAVAPAGTTRTAAPARRSPRPASEPPRAAEAQPATEPETADIAPSAPEPAAALADIDMGALEAAMKQAAASASGCREDGGPTGHGRIAVTLAPSGRVSQAVVEAGPFVGTTVGSCIAKRFRAATVPPFGGEFVTVRRAFAVR